MGLQGVLQWFVQHPFGGAGFVYAVAIAGVLMYTFIEHQLKERSREA